jgi:tetratricopeptide (TPR) repeat protein
LKKYFVTLMFTIVMLFSVFPQDRTPPAMISVKSPYYEVLFDGGSADAALLSREMEGRFEAYKRLFHFNPQDLTVPFKVRAYRNKQDYDAYVAARLGGTRPGVVYLHYNQPERRELVIHRGSPDEATMLPHQAFIQYFRGFIPYPPSWMREGFAIYFNTLTFNPASPGTALAYKENLTWLDTVKGLGNKAPALQAVLLADRDGIPDPKNFPGISWSLISFFLNSGKEDYFRILIESFMLLSRSASAMGNAEAVANHIARWIDLDTLAQDYKAYMASRKTFAQLLDEGQKAYIAKDTPTAELAFLNALGLEADHFEPYYYLGLLAFEGKEYELAEHYYRSALQYGADQALVSYALGLNAVEAGRNADAIGFLEKAKVLAPARYTQLVDRIIQQLR